MVICLERVSDDLSDVFCAMQVLVFSSTPGGGQFLKVFFQYMGNTGNNGTHAHPFNGCLSGTTRVSRYQKG